MTALSILQSFLAFLFIGCAGGALVSRAFAEIDEAVRRDAAISLAIPVGLVAAGLPGWLLSALTRVPIGGVAIPLGAATLLAIVVLLRRDLLGIFSTGEARRLIVPVALPLLVFALFLFLRSGSGEIRGTEKPLDFAVLNALLSSDALPLGDPWFSGMRFPYYHFGTYLFALPFRVGGMAPECAYNVVVALVAALAASAVFGAVRLRGGSRVPALGGAFFLAMAGTPDGLRQLVAGRSLAELDVWASSRRVVNTITEWPFFTLHLGDLHPHAVAMPFLVVLAGVAGRGASRGALVLEGILAGALVSANPWDLPAALLVLFAGNLAERGLRSSVVRCFFTCLVAVPVVVPFLLAPRPEFQGLRTAAASTSSSEAFLHLGAMLAVPALALGVALVRSRKKQDEALLTALVFPALGLVLAVLFRAPVLGLGLAFLAASLHLLSDVDGAPRAGFLLASAAAAMLLIPELVAVRDPYGEVLHRMNTVFKCYAAAGAVLPVALGLLLPLVLSTRRARLAIGVVLSIVLVSALAHPAQAIYQAVNAKKRELDGLSWMRRESPGDAGAVAWLRKNAPPGAIVLESVGGAYDDHARIGTASGHPTYLGWAGHEGLWRGAAGSTEVSRRQRDVRLVYTSRDEALVRRVLRDGKVRYVVTGPLERKDFGPEAFSLHAAFRAVFSEKGSTIYEVTP